MIASGSALLAGGSEAPLVPDIIPTFIAAYTTDNGVNGVSVAPRNLNDLLVLVLTRHADGVPPDLPSADWTSTAADGKVMVLAGTGIGVRIAWRLAPTTATIASAASVGAQTTVSLIYRGVDLVAPVSTGDLLATTTTTTTSPGLILPDGPRLILGGAKMDGGGIAPLRSGLVLREAEETTDAAGNPVVQANAGDSLPGVYDTWAAQNIGIGIAQEVISWSLAVKGAPGV